MNYTEQEINEYLALAQEVGITKAKRELGYPKSWDTGRKWADARGIAIPVDDVRARAANMREWYKDEDVITIAQEGMSRVMDDLTTKVELTADDQNKLARAFTSYVKDWLTIQGRSNAITESRSGDGIDEGLAKMLAEERAKNLNRKETGENVI